MYLACKMGMEGGHQLPRGHWVGSRWRRWELLWGSCRSGSTAARGRPTRQSKVWPWMFPAWSCTGTTLLIIGLSGSLLGLQRHTGCSAVIEGRKGQMQASVCCPPLFFWRLQDVANASLTREAKVSGSPSDRVELFIPLVLGVEPAVGEERGGTKLSHGDFGAG